MLRVLYIYIATCTSFHFSIRIMVIVIHSALFIVGVS